MYANIHHVGGLTYLLFLEKDLINICSAGLSEDNRRETLPIPAFSHNGLIPPFVGGDATAANRSPYFATMVELTQALAATDERKLLVRNLLQYRRMLTGEGYIYGLQFIDGSFVENVEATARRSPRDIDIFSILNRPTKYAGADAALLQAGGAFWHERVANRVQNKATLNLDTYAVLVEELDLSSLLHHVMYWQSLFSHQRDTFAWKGFVAIMLNAADDDAASAMLGNA